MLEEYSDLVTSFGEKKTVLDLKDSAEVKETIAKIFEELSVQNSELGELSERFEAFEDKEEVSYRSKVKLIDQGNLEVLKTDVCGDII